MKIKKILYATNLEKPTYELCEGLTDIKEVGLEEIVLLSVGLPEELLKKFTSHGITVRGIDGSGQLIPGILDSAKREGVSLIVADIRREKRGLFTGSTTRNLIQKSHLPLLIVKEGSYPKEGIFHSVVFATDWSETAQKALDYTLGIKKLIGVLDIVNVINEKLTVKEIRELKGKVEDIRKVCLQEKIDAESHIYAGKTTEEILLAVKDYDATVIVMGTRCRGAVKGLLSGSSSYRVAEEAPVPLLVIP